MKLTREELEKYLTQVAHYMGGWRIDSRCEYRLYLMADGLKISVRQANHTQAEQGRLFFWGVLPHGYSSSIQNKSISVSFSRSPKSVANDIKKKLLTELKEETEKAKLWLAEKRCETDAIENLVNLIRNVGFDSFQPDYRDKSYLKTLYASNGDIRLTIEASEKYNCSIKADYLSKDQLIKLAYFIKSI